VLQGLADLSVWQALGYGVSSVSLLVLLFYYWFIFGRLAFYKIKKRDVSLKPVSVVISARNEYLNLKANLPYILEQDYPEFEVVVVDDCSDDDTGYLLKNMAKQNPVLKVATLSSTQNFFKGKKFPLSIGIKAAKYEQILLTDADCKPVSRQWIREMQSGFHGEKQVVLGFSPYRKSKGLLNLLVRFETFMTGMQYLSFALNGITYMGVGRNLAYLRSLFFAEKGFTRHYHVASGDDDLFVNSVAKYAEIGVVISNESFTESSSEKTFSGWISQKRRHLTTGKYYRGKHKILLALFPLLILLLYISIIYLFLSTDNIIFPASLLFAKLLSQLIVFKMCMKKLGQRNFFLISPFLELLFVFLIPLITLTNSVKQPDQWR